ncbi:D-galacturonate reductase [Balamuthia mandrillaris]
MMNGHVKVAPCLNGHHKEEVQQERLEENRPALQTDALTLNTGNMLSCMPEMRALGGATELLRMLEIAIFRTRTGKIPDAKIGEKKHQKLKLTARLYLSSEATAQNVREALEAILLQMDVTMVDTVLLSCKASHTHFLQMWKELEQLHAEGKVTTLGLCEFMRADLESLLPKLQIKPRVNQVSRTEPDLASLLQFCKKHNIVVLSDPGPSSSAISSLPVESLLSKYFVIPPESEWTCNWAVRYGATFKCRSIVARKGYIFRCEQKKTAA